MFIESIFKLFALLFDKIPFLSSLKGYRSFFGFLGLAGVVFLRQQELLSPDILQALEVGFMGFTALALNAKGRKE